MNIAVFLDEVMPINGPLLLIPGSHKQGMLEAGHDKLTTSYPLWTLDKETVTRLCADAEAAYGAGIVAPTGKPGSVLMFHGNLVHASPPNITPYPRKIVYVTFCAFSNHITKFTRAGMDRAPRLHADRAGRRRRAAGVCARAPRGGGVKPTQYALKSKSTSGAIIARARQCESTFKRRVSSAACARSQSRNLAIFGKAEVAFGQTIQYVLDILRETSIGLTRRPLIRSHAASAVRASAMPWPSMAASISMLARFKIGP